MAECQGYSSSGSFSAGICVEKLIDLTDVQCNGHSPMLNRTPVGYVESLISPLNKQGCIQIPVQDGEKRKQVRIKYTPRSVTSQVRTTPSDECIPDDYPDMCETTFDVTEYVEKGFGIKEREVAKICEGNDEWLQRSLLIQFDALARTINENLLTQQSLNFGINVATGNNLVKSVNVITAANGQPLPIGIQEVDIDFRLRNQMSGNPIVVGAGNFYKYNNTLKVGCCNTSGVDMLALMNQLGYAFFMDASLENILNANEFIVYEPTKIQFVPYNENVGDNMRVVSNLFSHSTITDPRTGIVYDLDVRYDDCKKEWFVKMYLNYGIFFTPSDAFQFADPLFQVNGSLYYEAAAV